MEKFKKEREFRIKFQDTILLINQQLEEIPVLVGEYAIYYYFESILHMFGIYKEDIDFSKVELLISKKSMSLLKEKLEPQGYTLLKENLFQKEGIHYQFDVLENYSLSLEHSYLVKDYYSGTIENEKIIWKQMDIWQYRILNFENLKKYYEKKNDVQTLEEINAYWDESLRRKEKERDLMFSYEPEDINKNINNTEYLEIVSDFASLGSIKKVFPNHYRTMMPLVLNIGDIKDIYEGKRSWLVKNDEDYEIEKWFQELHRLLSKVRKVRIWSSRVCSDEFLMFCFLCDYIKEKEIYVTFADDFLEETWSIGCMTKEEVKALILKEHLLTKEDILYYQNLWKKVLEVNSEIRYMKQKEVVSVSFDYFTDIILEFVAKNQEISVCKLTATLMGYRVIENFGTLEYCYMIKRLITLGKLEVVDDGKELDNVKYFGADSFSYSIIKVKGT